MARLASYRNARRDIEQICKDKAEKEDWIESLKSLISPNQGILISPNQGGRSKIDGWTDGVLCFDDSKELTSSSPSNSSVSPSQDSVCTNINTSPGSYWPENPIFNERSHVEKANMQVKGAGSDAFRVSISSVPSTSSHGSALDDSDAVGDVYIWGEVTCENFAMAGAEKNTNSSSARTDVLLPRLLESDIVLDVHSIACGVEHAAIVTREGKVFTWGEESRGRLGHGAGMDITHPRPVESLFLCNVNLVACGDFHTCAVTTTGELYTWGDATHRAGLLGHGGDVSHWIPRRISGKLEGFQVAMVTCGPWHTALVTNMGQLFTFGDGTFGVLGHGDRENVLYPREVESLAGLRTIAVACGVWHTAAVVEVIVTQSSATFSSGKLFTWGDGENNRLGHGDREPRLEPTCVPLVDYDFQKVACGHSLTVGLTMLGQVFTFGASVYGQLGNSCSDGKLPCLVEDKLAGECVEEIACGAYHVTVLTSRHEVFTWGKGGNGRLGHGDVEDRKTPAMVEALKDRHVKCIACGSNYTAVICLHRLVSGGEQSHQCCACRQVFGFTRKRHICYNCGLVHCHSCSSRKALKAAMAPSDSKAYRVCDSCYTKLSKVSEGGGNHKKASANRLSGESKDALVARMPSNLDLINQWDIKTAKQGKKADAFFLMGPFQTPLVVDLQQFIPKSASRPVSPFSRRSSPPRSATPVPTPAGLSFSKNASENLKRTNEILNMEVNNLRAQIDSLRQRCRHQESELEKSANRMQEAVKAAAEESAKSKAAKEVIKSLVAQLKEMAERLPGGGLDANGLRLINLRNCSGMNGFHLPDANSECHSRGDSGADLIGSGSFSLSPRNHNSGSYSGPPLPTNVWDKDPRARLANGTGTGDGNQAEVEWIEHFEPGVYLTVGALPDGTRELKRVRFSWRKFREEEAGIWLAENREKLRQRYKVNALDKSSVAGRGRSDGTESPL